MIFIASQNIVEENSPGVGSNGGTCRCPDGLTYAVGDNQDDCASLACPNGETISCNRHEGVWSHRKVTCASRGKSPRVQKRTSVFNDDGPIQFMENILFCI